MGIDRLRASLTLLQLGAAVVFYEVNEENTACALDPLSRMMDIVERSSDDRKGGG